MSDFTIEQLEALKEGTTPGPWEAKDDHGGPNLFSPTGRLLRSDSCGDVSGEEDDVNLMAAAPALVDALITEKRAHQKLRDEMGELVEYLSIQEGNCRTSRLYVHGQRSAMELIKDILEGE